MQSWVWAIIGGVPLLAVGTAYAMGAFSTSSPVVPRSTSFMGDEAYATGLEMSGGRRKRTKKSKSGLKKTKRRG